MLMSTIPTEITETSQVHREKYWLHGLFFQVEVLLFEDFLKDREE